MTLKDKVTDNQGANTNNFLEAVKTHQEENQQQEQKKTQGLYQQAYDLCDQKHRKMLENLGSHRD